MSTWEYTIVASMDIAGGSTFKGEDRSAVDQYLNKLGTDSWEIINLDFTGVAKRAKPS